MSIVTDSIIDIKKIDTIESTVAIKADQTAVDTALGLKADTTTVDTALGLKADKASTYTKSETDAKIVELAPSEIDDSQITLTNTWSASKIDTELDTKQDTLVSGTNIKTLNGDSILGAGDLSIVGGGLQSVQVFTASGTWTRPENIKLIKATLVGGGGGGGSNQTSSVEAAGGGGGATTIAFIDVSLISSLTITVGAGGAGATIAVGGSPTAGGNSSISGVVSFIANGARASTSTTYGGLGGIASSVTLPNISINGEKGGTPNTASNSTGHGGAAYFFPQTAPPSYDAADRVQTQAAYGCGGHGGASFVESTNGGNGIVIIEEYK